MRSTVLAVATLGGVLVNAGIDVPRYPLLKRSNASSSWTLDQFTNLLTFGDSYTDENRLGYFGSHNGMAPPPGTVLPEVSHKKTYSRSICIYEKTNNLPPSPSPPPPAAASGPATSSNTPAAKSTPNLSRRSNSTTTPSAAPSAATRSRRASSSPTSTLTSPPFSTTKCPLLSPTRARSIPQRVSRPLRPH